MVVVGKTSAIPIGRASVSMRTTVPSFVVKMFDLRKDSELLWNYEDGRMYITANSPELATKELLKDVVQVTEEQQNMAGLKGILLNVGLVEMGANRYASDGKMQITFNNTAKFKADQIRLTKEHLILYVGDNPDMQFRYGAIDSIGIEAVE